MTVQRQPILNIQRQPIIADDLLTKDSLKSSNNLNDLLSEVQSYDLSAEDHNKAN